MEDSLEGSEWRRDGVKGNWGFVEITDYYAGGGGNEVWW